MTKGILIALVLVLGPVSAEAYTKAALSSVSLVGPAQMAINANQTFVDPWVVALGQDGQEAFVVVEGWVNTRVPGEYRLVYKAFDDFGNQQSVVRTVRVVPEGQVLGAYTMSNEAQIKLIKEQLVVLIGQLIVMLQAEIAKAI